MIEKELPFLLTDFSAVAMEVFPSFSNAVASSPLNPAVAASAAAASLNVTPMPQTPLNMSSVGGSVAGQTSPESLEMAGRRVEEMLHRDSEFPALATKLKIGELGFQLC